MSGSPVVLVAPGVDLLPAADEGFVAGQGPGPEPKRFRPGGEAGERCL